MKNMWMHNKIILKYFQKYGNINKEATPKNDG
jgi:hypothetical protein